MSGENRPGLRRRVALGDPVPYADQHRPGFASGALAPQGRVDLDIILRPGSAARIGRAADSGGAWREQDRGLRAVWGEDVPVDLGNLTAEDSLDLFIAVAEIARTYARDARVAAFAEREIAAGEAIRDARKTSDGRSEPLGRMLGIQPSSPATAGPRVARKVRNDLLRHVRQAVPAWRNADDGVVAVDMEKSFYRYRAGGWQADQERPTAPAPEPAATWWRLLKLKGANTLVPGRTTLVAILRGADLTD